MKKRLLSTLLALCMALALLPGTAWADGGTSILTDEDGTKHYLYTYERENSPNPPTSGDGWNWDRKNRTLTLTGYQGECIDCGDVTKIILADGSTNIVEVCRIGCAYLNESLIIEGTGELIATKKFLLFAQNGPIILKEPLQMTGGTNEGDTGILTYDKTVRTEQSPVTSSGETASYVRIGPNTSNPAPSNPITTPVQPAENETPATSTGFTDVAASDYFAAPVTWALEKGITTGTSTTTFSPNQTCTNAQILTFLWRAYGEPEPTISNPFTNSIPDAYVKAAVWAYEKGMVSGTAFDVDNSCTRAMAVMYMWQAAGSPTAPAASFTDVSAGASYAPAVAWALEQKITTGTDEAKGTFSPDDVCNRGQIVTFLYRNLA